MGGHEWDLDLWLGEILFVNFTESKVDSLSDKLLVIYFLQSLQISDTLTNFYEWKKNQKKTTFNSNKLQWTLKWITIKAAIVALSDPIAVD